MSTASLTRPHTFHPEPNPRSLGNILYAFDQTAWHTHNAGNDAVYTLWAVLALSVGAAAQSGSPSGTSTDAPQPAAAPVEAAPEAKKGKGVQEWETKASKVVFGPERPPPKEPTRFWTVDGEPLDI